MRLDPYRFTDEELHAAIARLLDDKDLRTSLDAAGAKIRDSDGLREAADAIEALGRR